MKNQKPDLAEALRSHFQETQPAEHPTPETLAAHRAGELSAELDESVQQHLVECGDCTELVLDLEHFKKLAEAPEVEQSETELSEFEVAAAWRRQRTRLREASFFDTGGRRPWRLLQAVAASLLVTTLGLTVWVVELRRTVQEFRQPEFNVPIINVEPADSMRSPQAAPTIEIPSEVGRWILILNPTVGHDYPEYRVAFTALDGSWAWSRNGLHESPSGNFVLEMASDFVPAGSCHIVLSGLRDGRSDQLEDYTVVVVRP